VIRVRVLLLVALAAGPGCAGLARSQFMPALEGIVRVWRIRYRAHNGLLRSAYVVLPGRYGPDRPTPPLPLVISPHGRGISALANLRFWRDLPALGGFAVVNPEGQGRRLTLYSWGDRGQIDDLARMPGIVSRALPWLHLDRSRVYAFGGSMGGQEVLLLVARFPHLLAGAAAFDAPANLALRYRDFAHLRDGTELQRLARYEVGGTPREDGPGYATRSPIDLARRIAFSRVPVQLWWSTHDRVVDEGRFQSGLLCRRIRRLNPAARVEEFVGRWRHTADMRPGNLLPVALRRFGLLPRHRSAAARLDGIAARHLDC
jgi:hypothetical protein